MRLVLLALAACSNAANPSTDAPLAPIDAAGDSGSPDAPIGLRILVVNEVAAGDTPDWFEVVNVTGGAIQLDQFVYCDVPNDFAKAKAFPAMTLGPGEYHAQDVDDTISGFKLGSDEELWIYRSSDQALSDGVDWAEAAAPTGMSFRRVPDRTGAFATGEQSKGVANP
ncbi:MAG: hypothetical protein ABI867_16090 [Kofleriaceae bacterium]